MLLVDIGGRLISGETVVLSRRRRARRLYPGLRLSSELLNYARHWHYVRVVKQTFHRRSRRRHHRRFQ